MLLKAKRHLLILFVVGLATLAPVAVALAQTNTPVPVTTTLTLVPLSIPINPIMEQTNTWMNTFAPIAAIGIGITLAIAILAYIGNMIKRAF